MRMDSFSQVMVRDSELGQTHVNVSLILISASTMSNNNPC